MLISLPSGQAPKWDSADAAALRQLLQSELFQRALVLVAQFDSPALLDGSDVNKTLVASGRAQGFSDALSALFRLTIEQPPETVLPEAYPNLDDDSKWQDIVNKL